MEIFSCCICRFDVVQLKNKRVTPVPLLLSPIMKNAMNVLLECRRANDLFQNNPYFFAADSCNANLKIWRVSQDIFKLAQLEKPYLLCLPKIRKYVSTVSQVLKSAFVTPFALLYNSFCVLPVQIFTLQGSFQNHINSFTYYSFTASSKSAFVAPFAQLYHFHVLTVQRFSLLGLFQKQTYLFDIIVFRS